MPVGKVGKLGVTAGRIGFDTATESLEEGYQHAIQQQATGSDNRSVLQQIINPTQAGKESMAIGGIFGAGMGGVGAITDAMRGSEPQLTPEQLQQQYTQTWQDINQAYGNANKIPGQVNINQSIPFVQQQSEGKFNNRVDLYPEVPTRKFGRIVSGKGRYQIIRPGESAEVTPEVELESTMPTSKLSRTLTGAGQYKVVRPGEVETITPEPTIEKGKVVYNPKGQALTVVDDSHPTELTVRGESGHVFKIDRKHVKPEPPAGVKPKASSTADQIQQAFGEISRSATAIKTMV